MRFCAVLLLTICGRVSTLLDLLGAYASRDHHITSYFFDRVLQAFNCRTWYYGRKVIIKTFH